MPKNKNKPLGSSRGEFLSREDNQQAGKSWTWTYDDAGNILSKKEYAYTTGTLGTVQSTKSYTYGNSNWGDLLTAYNGNTISSDAIGNMTNDGTWTYTWEHGRELATMSSGGTTWNFTYDADGMRTKRTNGSNTYTYTYIGGQLSFMTVNGQAVYITHDASGQPMTINYGGTTYYYATNLQGDVTAIVNTSGTAVVTYTYDAWGNILSIGGTMASTLGAANPLRYRGYVYDQETGLYYLQSRYYNPALGRFINGDAFATTGQGLLGNNMFAYCCNTPVSTYDPSGCLMVPADPYKGGPTGPGSTTSQKGSIGYVSKGTIKQNVDEYVNNTDIETVYEAPKIAFYNGTPVIRHSIPDLTSWAIGGMIFLNTDLNSSSPEAQEQTLMHEYGHILQEKDFGLLKYTFIIFIPSASINLIARTNEYFDNNYYSMPWEYDADMRGQVVRDVVYAGWAAAASDAYFGYWG